MLFYYFVAGIGVGFGAQLFQAVFIIANPFLTRAATKIKTLYVHK